MMASFASAASETDTESPNTPPGFENRGSATETVPLVWRAIFANRACACSCWAWRAETSGQTVAQINRARQEVTSPETLPVMEPKIERKPPEVRTAEL